MDFPDEDEVIWLDDIAKYPYVRASVVTSAFRAKQPRWACKVVGYTTVRQDVQREDGFMRRVFWVKPYDRSEQPYGVYRTGRPAEAVDPRKVRVGWLVDD